MVFTLIVNYVPNANPGSYLTDSDVDVLLLNGVLHTRSTYMRMLKYIALNLAYGHIVEFTTISIVSVITNAYAVMASIMYVNAG